MPVDVACIKPPVDFATHCRKHTKGDLSRLLTSTMERRLVRSFYQHVATLVGPQLHCCVRWHRVTLQQNDKVQWTSVSLVASFCGTARLPDFALVSHQYYSLCPCGMDPQEAPLCKLEMC